MEDLVFKIQEVKEAPPQPKPLCFVVWCICGSRLRLYATALEDDSRYNRACLAVKSWMAEHQDCPLTRPLPGFLALRRKQIRKRKVKKWVETLV